MAAPRPPSRRARRRRAGFDLFSVAGIRITVDYSWFIIFVLVAVTVSGWFQLQMPDSARAVHWLFSATAALLLFVSVLLHELSHSLVARAKGIPVARITLFIFGGVSQLGREPDRPVDEFQIAIVGPLTSFALGGFCALAFSVSLSMDAPGLSALLFYLATINIALGMFNLVPAYPLDGGRILRAVLWSAHNSFARATVSAARVSTMLAFLLMGLGVTLVVFGGNLAGLWWVLVGFFVRRAATASARRALLQQALEDTPVLRVMSDRVVSVSPDDILSEVANGAFMAHHFHAFPVAEGRQLRGMLSLADVKKVPRDERHERTVGEAMTPLTELEIAGPDEPLTTVLERMAETGRHRMPVVREGLLAGMVTRQDIMDFLRVQTEPAG